MVDASGATDPRTNGREADDRPYEIRISRLTIDKLGVKLYDKVSAAVAELAANGYDADAEKVTIRLPLSTVLAKKGEDGQPVESAYVIEVEDNGHGMTPSEAIDYYLEVGKDRRRNEGQGPRSREKSRPVMGRKGIGKLAPFGICRHIEVISAGGSETPEGYLVSHFHMDFDDIVQDTDEPVPLTAGDLDRTYAPKRGTKIRLSRFLPKKVPDAETFHRQLATRFVFARPDFEISVEDSRNPEANPPRPVNPLAIPLNEETKVDLSDRPVVTEDGERLPVKGWLAKAKNAYKDEETAGVRIYAREKIVAQTRDFEQPAGYTGEFTMRSYLVGEVHAEWLDQDEGEDLVRTDRQGIVWDSDYGRALREWGAKVIKEIAAASKQPRRQRASEIFLEKSNVESRASERFADEEVAKVAVDLAKQIGSFAAEDELEDEGYVEGLTEVILSVAPHKALIQAFQDFNKEIGDGDVSLEEISDLFRKTRIAEMASYGQVAAERVKALRELEKIVHGDYQESDLQNLIARAPWLIEPTWSVISKNQQLKTFKAGFENFWKKRTGEDVNLAITFEKKKPDFTLVSVGHTLHIVEIKKSGHEFDDADHERMINYVYAFREFFENNKSLKAEFPQGWQIDLVADGVKLRNLSNRSSFEGCEQRGEVKRTSWHDFLTRAKTAHQQFLDINERLDEVAS